MVSFEGWDIWCLYLSHFLSMFNSKLYEYAVIIFIQAAFPGDLLAISILGVTETCFSLFLSSALGAWVDRASRLDSLLKSILVNRSTVFLSSLIWLFILVIHSNVIKGILFAVVVGLSFIERGSLMVNLISMERDWVPTISSGKGPIMLTHLNSVMRRIDIGCKLLAPLAAASFITTATPKYSCLGIAILSMFSYSIERWCIMLVWEQQPQLREAKEKALVELTRIHATEPVSHAQADPSSLPIASSLQLIETSITQIRRATFTYLDRFRFLFGTVLWVPAIAIGLSHASFLTFDKTLIAYLLNAKFSLNLITVARSVASAFEMGSTIIFPIAVGTLSVGKEIKDHSQYAVVSTDENDLDEELDEHGIAPKDSTYTNSAVVAIASVGSAVHVVLLLPTLVTLISLDHEMLETVSAENRSLTASSALFLFFLSLSYLGRWTFDLAFTQLSQTLVPGSMRGTFAGVEAQLIGFIKLMAWMAAIVWHSQSDFKWLATGSFIALLCAMIGVVRWSRLWHVNDIFLSG